ncbi:MAG: hypothetical protein WDM79_14750 [Terricaulis sp.]
MEHLISLSGLLGAACCVGMYAAVSMGKVSPEKPVFFIVNGIGALLVLIGAAHEFDTGDIGTIGQELIWAAISLIGGGRAWLREGGGAKLDTLKARVLRGALRSPAA